MATILVIEDSDGQRAEIQDALEAANLFDRILLAPDGIRGLKLLLSETVDLVLCDLEMPGIDGEKILRMHESSSRRDAPFLFLTASSDTERKIRLLERGAFDTIVKPFHRAELIARIRLHLQVKQLRDELRAKNQVLEQQSRTDALTGLCSRRFLEERLETEFARARRHGLPLSLLICDLDHFKRVNDTHGHPAGDAVLRALADVLRATVRETDVAARYGGEEFVALLPQSDLDGACILAERFRGALELLPIVVAGGRSVHVTASIGAAAFHPDLADAEALVREADDALYRAKAAGRNRVERAPLPKPA